MNKNISLENYRAKQLALFTEWRYLPNIRIREAQQGVEDSRLGKLLNDLLMLIVQDSPFWTELDLFTSNYWALGIEMLWGRMIYISVFAQLSSIEEDAPANNAPFLMA